MRFQGLYVNDNAPLALRAIPGHSIIDADPMLMRWEGGDQNQAPRVYLGARFCIIARVALGKRDRVRPELHVFIAALDKNSIRRQRGNTIPRQERSCRARQL